MAESNADDGRDAADTPLDPAAERLRRKLVRLLFASGGIMMLGLIAVFAAIVHRLGSGDDPPVARPSAAALAIPLPPGARLVASALDGDRALLTLQSDGGATSLLLVDLGSGVVVGTYALRPAPTPP